MDDRKKKLDDLYNAAIALLGKDLTRIEIAITHDGMEINTYDRHKIDDYSMQRISGEWVERA